MYVDLRYANHNFVIIVVDELIIKFVSYLIIVDRIIV